MKKALYLAPSAIAVAVMASSLSVGVQAAGFVEDAKVTLGLRNYYFNRNFLNQTQGGQGQAEGWTQ
ncbi:MAG: OprD family porin, partial [Pseudomonas sp.]|nr:OprD family porin [Pseudomonas sp.]